MPGHLRGHLKGLQILEAEGRIVNGLEQGRPVQEQPYPVTREAAEVRLARMVLEPFHCLDHRVDMLANG